jgi:ATP-binding cassette subfamily B protein
MRVLLRYRLFLQDAPNDCGVACLASVLWCHGRFITPIDLGVDLEVTRYGVSVQELRRAAQKHGLEQKLIALPVGEFHRLKNDLPAIALVRNSYDQSGHFVVVYEVQSDFVMIGDPAQGKTKIKYKNLEQMYEGHVLLLSPTEDFKPEKISQSYSASLLFFSWQHAKLILIALLFGIIFNVFQFGAAYSFKSLIDSITSANAISNFLMIYMAVRLSGLGTSLLSELFVALSKKALHKALAMDYIEQLVHLRKKDLDSRDPGNYLYQLSLLDQLNDAITTYFSRFILVVLGILIKIALISLLFETSVVLTISFFLVLAVLTSAIFYTKINEKENERQLLSGKINTVLLNLLKDIRVVRVFGATAWLRQDFDRNMGKLLNSNYHLSKIQSFSGAINQALAYVSELALIILIYLSIQQSQSSLGDFMLILTIATQLNFETQRFPELVFSYQFHVRSFARLRSITRLGRETSGDQRPVLDRCEIELEDVSFSYLRQQPIIRNLSATFKAGQTTAIVGESGSGKTTIANLLCGFYIPKNGRIKINGIDVQSMDLQHYRKHISCVFQEVPIYDRSVFDNITLGDPKITLEHIKNTATMLGIDGFIQSLPEGYKTMLYQGSLSGGETQRIGILRAACRPAAVLLLDEATSYLDTLSEQKVLRGLWKLNYFNQIITIAHRLSTVEHAENIIVMKKGVIVEQGNHRDLLAKHGYYSKLNSKLEAEGKPSFI